MGKHSKDGEHHCGQTAKDTGYTGKHREAPVFEVRSPAEQAAYIQQQQRTPLHRRPCPPSFSPVNGVESTGTGGPDPVPGCGRVGSATQADRHPTNPERIDVSKFQIGDKVAMPGVPFVVEVLELGTCDLAGCDFGDGETFRFKDPGGLGDDWEHTSLFEKV